MRWLYAIIGVFIAFALGYVSEAQALPRNFRNVDTFFVGAMPNEDDLTEMKMLGITTIVSLHRLDPAVKKKAERLGFQLYSFPLRTRLINIEKIIEAMQSAPEHSVYLHCLHGADRTGAVTAYWLSSVRHYSPFAALASVISPKDMHIKGYKQLGREYGVCLPDFPEDWLGKYSGARNGGLEGLKICGDEWYTRLARNYLLMTIGEPVNSKNDKFWNRFNNLPKAPKQKQANHESGAK